MEKFSARENPFGGSIPDTLGLWKSLTVFYCHGCNLYGSIPHSIFNLSLLVNLSLSVNHLTGSLPSEIGNQFPNLEFLQLWGNKLTGVIPPSISNCSKLGYIEMSNNSFSGKLTIDFSKLRDIKFILLQNINLHGRGEADDMRFINSLENCTSLAENQLFGSLLSSIGSLAGLTTLYLDSNQFEGKVPSTIGKLQNLQILGNISIFGEYIGLSTLNLRGNIFQGIIPLSLSSLRGLEVFDISQNNLSGNIPQFLDKWVSLEFLDLSFNDFEGEVPIAGVFANISAFSVLGNNKLCGGLVTLELPKCKEKGSKKKRFPFSIFVIVIAPALLIVLCCVYVLCKKKRNSQPSQSLGNERFLKVSYSDLLKATDGFSAKNLIGGGGFSSVYKGILDFHDDKLVAVKVLHLQNRGAHRSFLAECEAWRNIRHRNLLKIITSCSSTDFQGNDFKALVYEYMSNGSVHDWLHSSANTSKLNLLQRINILRDVAAALDYLHIRCQTTIVHGDLKPSNILLDDDMVAHVGDFGLARLLGTNLNQNSSTGVKGTIDHVVDVIDGDAICVYKVRRNAKKVEESLAGNIKLEYHALLYAFLICGSPSIHHHRSKEKEPSQRIAVILNGGSTASEIRSCQRPGIVAAKAGEIDVVAVPSLTKQSHL
ncbi:kinase-like domain-containing protein [Tanacetum coccineum]